MGFCFVKLLIAQFSESKSSATVSKCQKYAVTPLALIRLVTFTSFLSLISVTAILAPCCAKRNQVDSPIPIAPSVTIIILSFTLFMGNLLVIYLREVFYFIIKPIMQF